MRDRREQEGAAASASATHDIDDFDLGWIGSRTGRAERRQITVLAVGFATPDPGGELETLLALHSHRRRRIASIVTRFGGTIGRIDPETHLAAWGWRSSCDADTRLAVAAAVEIAAEPMLAASCGVDAGIAITPEAEDPIPGFDFVGGMISGAAAQLSAAAVGEALVSDAVRRLLGSAFELVACIRPAGADRSPVRSWLATRQPEHRAGRPRRVQHMTGREAELAQLAARWHSAMSGTAEPLVLAGETGAGKTALLLELERKVHQSKSPFLLVQCTAEAGRLPLSPVSVLAEHLARLPGPLLPMDNGGPVMIDRLLYAGDAMGAALLAECRARIARGADPATIADSIVALLAHKASARPLAIAFDDLHWAQQPAIDVLVRLPELAGSGVRALLVATCSGEYPTTAAALTSRWPVLSLRRLTPEHIEHILMSGEHHRCMSPGLLRRIVGLADGNPLYAAELARLCTDMRELDIHPRLLAHPNRLNAALTSRLDSLETLKPLAQAASVLGRLFDSRVLAAALDMDVRVINERLDALVDRAILGRRRHGVQTYSYRFEDALLWSQAYGSVVRSRRQRLHLRLAAALTDSTAQIPEPAPDLVAYHWSKGGDHARAFGWWAKAARAAAEQSATAKALAFANEGLAALENAPEAASPQERATLTGLHAAQLRILRGSAALETEAAFERAVATIRVLPLGESDLDLEVAWGLTQIQILRGEVHQASLTSGKLLQDATERGRDDFVMVALRLHGTARLMGGAVREAVALLTDATSRYDPRLSAGVLRKIGPDQGPVALAHLATAQALAGDRAGALSSRRRALALAGEIGHPLTSANTMGVLATQAMLMDEPGVAAAMARGVLEVADRNGHTYWKARARLILAYELGLRLTPGNGLVILEAALADYRALGSERMTSLVACIAAERAIAAGHPTRAVALIEPLRRRAEKHGEWMLIPEMLRIEAAASAQIATAPDEAACQQLADAEAMASEQGSIVLAERAADTRRMIEQTTRPGSRMPARLRPARSPAARRSP
jgi:hypothetical protein